MHSNTAREDLLFPMGYAKIDLFAYISKTQGNPNIKNGLTGYFAFKKVWNDCSNI
jgi:hypothetical protein